MLDIATDLDIIHKAGSWFSYNDERLGQGRDNIREYLKENPEFCDEIEQKIRDHFMPKDEDKEEEPKTDGPEKEKTDADGDEDAFELGKFEE